MLYTKSAPVGIDIPIQNLQTILHTKLNEVWQMSAGDYRAYGRCYRNQKDSGYVAEWYIGSREYNELYLDDRVKVISFFGLNSPIDHKISNIAPVHLIFFVNVQSVKNLSHRGDEEVRVDVQNIVQGDWYGFNLNRVVLGIENVLDEYPGSLRDVGLKFRDMHPFHCFRFDFDLLYNINQC